MLYKRTSKSTISAEALWHDATGTNAAVPSRRARRLETATTGSCPLTEIDNDPFSSSLSDKSNVKVTHDAPPNLAVSPRDSPA